MLRYHEHQERNLRVFSRARARIYVTSIRAQTNTEKSLSRTSREIRDLTPPVANTYLCLDRKLLLLLFLHHRWEKRTLNRNAHLFRFFSKLLSKSNEFNSLNVYLSKDETRTDQTHLEIEEIGLSPYGRLRSRETRTVSSLSSALNGRCRRRVRARVTEIARYDVRPFLTPTQFRRSETPSAVTSGAPTGNYGNLIRSHLARGTRARHAYSTRAPYAILPG